MFRLAVIAISVSMSAVLAGCSAVSETSGITGPDLPAGKDKPLVVVGSTVVGSLVWDIAGDFVEVKSLVPNSVDAHTYEPLPSEAALIEDAELIVLADAELNGNVTSLVAELKSEGTRVVFLNEETLKENDFLFWDNYNRYGKNPHTWTNARFVWYWTQEIESSLLELFARNGSAATDLIPLNANKLRAEINKVHEEILAAAQGTPSMFKKMVVYHDAWEYFGREYGIDIIGSVQAFDYADPSPSQLANIIDDIRINNVQVFFGSEVFPSDVLETIATETGAEYISDLSDDSLPGELGSSEYLYVQLMRNNLQLIMDGIQ